MSTRRVVCILLVVLFVAAGITSQRLLGRTTPKPVAVPITAPVPDGFVRVVRVVDGDTIEVSDPSMNSGQSMRVRYIGVDTPETVHPSKPVQCFGHEASEFNRSLVENRFVRLERDISDTDTYDRLLRYVYLEDGTFVNFELVRGGYASVVTYPPDVAHTVQFQAAQADARSAGRGLWSACR